MSITKNQLKQIVKECLVEILSEGIGQTATSIAEAANKRPLQRPQAKIPHMSTVLQQTASKTKLNIPSHALSHSNAIKEAIKREAGNNDVMADILADTAANTLPAMLENDRTRQPLPPPGSIERVVATTTPDQLFGEDVASTWAALAFMDPIKK